MAPYLRTNLALFSGQLALSLLNTMFMFYYVKVFLNRFRVSEYWFNVAQMLYLIWNAVNDPLFGYIQDVGSTWMKDRSKVFTFVGPLMSLSFLVLWFPWSSESSPPSYVEGLHLIFSLLLYDAFYSCIGVTWGALFAETTLDHSRRVNALKYSQLAIMLSVNIIVVTEKASHSVDNFAMFQTVCVVVAILSCACFLTTGRLSRAPHYETPSVALLLDAKDRDAKSGGGDETRGLRAIAALTLELMSARDFQRIIVTNFIHTCRSVAHLNFAAIACDLLIPQTVLAKGSWKISVFYAACTLLPQILVVTNERTLARHGAYQIMQFGFLCSVLSSGLYVLSRSSFVVLFFMLIDSITVHAISPMFNILLAEFIEDDKLRNVRSRRMSSLIFSLNAFFSKPAASLAPMLIVGLLNRSGYVTYQHEGLRSTALGQCMRMIIFVTPGLLGALQYFLLRSYSLRSQHRLSVMPM